MYVAMSDFDKKLLTVIATILVLAATAGLVYSGVHSAQDNASLAKRLDH